jgi:hypothetical protein
MLMGTDISAGQVGGANNNQITLKTDQLPLHNHRVRIANGGGATPSGRVAASGRHIHTVGKSGRHTHDLTDPGHKHAGGDNPAAGSFVCLFWGGNNKIDALFNDRNHTYSVEALQWTSPALSNVRVSTARSEHWHNVDPNGEHTHTAWIDPIPEHEHVMAEDQVGGDTAFDITPEYLTVYSYVRS